MVKIKNIIFDFDGVILDSIPVKTEAFRQLFSKYPVDKVEELLDYHQKNGGVSRYKKVRYFFEVIMQQEISNEAIQEFCQHYSRLTKEELASKKYLILDAIDFISENFERYNIHIASGADHDDLLYICDTLGISKYFRSIYGSPRAKSEIIKHILHENHYKTCETCLIGDSINDLAAAEDNKLKFFAYNQSDSLLFYANIIPKLKGYYFG
ncbi:HAD family hydrolase [Facilibium subflavum]|uniref:HAD family hydrolase n=1 Tax=Facilibium subflavum TaxID=2219058 RepID=UPI001AADA51C|nr:HAD hydrolase-like protein [Facilibium subflavum]